jgi:hypothetical protein
MADQIGQDQGQKGYSGGEAKRPGEMRRFDREASADHDDSDHAPDDEGGGSDAYPDS